MTDYRSLPKFPGYRIGDNLDVQTFTKMGWKSLKVRFGSVVLSVGGDYKSINIIDLAESVFPNIQDLVDPFDSSVTYLLNENYPGYLFGDDGSVWTCKKGGGGLRKTYRKLSPYLNNKNRRITSLTDANGKSQVVVVARVVLETHVGPCPPKMEACHNDNNPSNDKLTNLRWDTRKGNHADKLKHGTHNKGSRHNLAKVDEVDVMEIRRLYESELHLPRYGRKYTMQYLANMFGLDTTMISKIIKRQNWKHI